jgi:Amt family ammonium transporter
LVHQLTGIVAVGAFVVVVSSAFWLFLKYTIGIRVSLREEIEGLDIGEHGNIAYPDFLIRKFTTGLYRTTSATVGAGVPDEADIVRSAKAAMSVEKGAAQIQKIEAIFRPERLSAVKNALERVGYPGVTVSEVDGHGKERGISQQWRGENFRVELIPKVKVEIVVERSEVDKIVNAIVAEATTGSAGDGKIFIHDMQGVVRIRTKEQGTVAVG